MFTNGLSFWSETVPDCTPNIGFFISDLKLSSMSDNIIAYYQREDKESVQYFKVFEPKGKNFRLKSIN